jgi:phosphohistidine phosphatase
VKRITLLRHAEAMPAGERPDRERPLSERGIHEATTMGWRFRERGARPSLILSSPAARAWQTARLLASAIGYPLEFLQREPELYLAPADAVLKVLSRQENTFGDILLCGHNPGLTELAARMTGEPIEAISTCGLAVVEADTAGWSALMTGRLVLVDSPPSA